MGPLTKFSGTPGDPEPHFENCWIKLLLLLRRFTHVQLCVTP